MGGYVVVSKTLARRRLPPHTHCSLTKGQVYCMPLVNLIQFPPKRWTLVSPSLKGGDSLRISCLSCDGARNEILVYENPELSPFIRSAGLPAGVSVGSGKDLGSQRGVGGCSELPL